MEQNIAKALSQLPRKDLLELSKKHNIENFIKKKNTELVLELSTVVTGSELGIVTVKKFWTKERKEKLNHLGTWLGVISFALSFVFYFFPFSPEPNKLQKLEEDFRMLRDPAVEVGVKKQLVGEIVRDNSNQTLVVLKGKHGTVIETMKLEEFCKNIIYGAYKDFSIEKLEKNEISIKVSSTL